MPKIDGAIEILNKIKNLFNLKVFIFTYRDWPSQLIVIKREKYHYNRKLQFKKALEELKSTEYIKDFKWTKRGKKSLLRLWPGKRFFAEVKERRKRWLKFNRTQKDRAAIG
jgi:hypothetical protein